jgi:phosphoglycolate phosphatase
MIDSVVFDLDGTLIDSLPDVLASLNLLLEEDRRRPLKLGELRNLVGRGVNPMVEDAYRLTGQSLSSFLQLENAVCRYIEHYKANPVGHTVVFPNVMNTLTVLKEKGICMGVCTNKPFEMTLLVLEGLRIKSFFAGVTGGDNLPYNKPDPRHILKTLELMKSDASNAVMVGDSWVDVKAARNAEIPVVAVSYGYNSDPDESLNADIEIKDMALLPEAIKNIKS